MRVLFTSLMLLVWAGTAPAQQEENLFNAARGGDLAKVKTLIEGGLSPDIRDRYGMTPLAVAVQADQTAVVRYLIEQKADVNIPDSFYGSAPMARALWQQQDEVVKLLLAAGGEPRDMALEFAVSRGRSDMARAAIAAGPIHEGTLERLRGRELSEELKAILAKATSRPDPKPPVLEPAQLKRLVGRFEGFDSDTRGVVSLRDGRLYVAIDGGEPVPLVATGERAFRHEQHEFRLQFVGRAGTVEGFQIFRENQPPDLLRHSVAEPVALRGAGKPKVTKMEKAGKYWPGFRGPGGRGIADGAPLPTDWDVNSKKGILWQAEVEGLGHASPVIWGDRIFLATAVAASGSQDLIVGNTGDDRGYGDEVPHTWLVLALDKNSGKQLWRREIGSAVPKTKRHSKASQANSTPVTDGKHVVVVFPTAGLACLDMDGNIVWQHDLGALNASAFTDPNMHWGFASSPIIHGGRVILQVDIYGEPYIAAWNLSDGKQVWKTPRDVATSWSTPVIFPTDQGEELVVNGSTIHGYDPVNGEELWSLGPNSELVVAMPVVGKDVVYVSAGYPPVKPIYAVRSGIRGKHRVEPGEPYKPLVWSHRRGGAYMPTPLLYRGWLFVVHYNGRLVVYRAETGEPVHKARFSKRGTFTASPIAVNGRVYIPTEEGVLYEVSADPGFAELAARDMGEPLMATPAVSEGVMFVRTASKLVAVGLEKRAAADGATKGR